MDILALIETVVNGLIKIEEDFLLNPKDLHSLEVATKTTTDDLAASFLSGVLSDLDKQIYNNSYRKSHYNAQRTRQRSLLSSVGELTFNNTIYRKKGEKQGGYVSLLLQVIDLDKNERFTEEAEVMMLTEALKTSYAEAARIIPSKQKVTKTTVMNKIHNLSDNIPTEEPAELRHNKYLFIEADEDHISEQHGDQSKPEDNKGCMRDTDDKTPIMWSIIYISLKDEKLVSDWVSEYRNDGSSLGEGVKIVEISKYLNGMYGQTIRNIANASVMTIALGAVIIIVVILLLMRLIIWKERKESSLKKALGLRTSDICKDYIKKLCLYVASGILLGISAGVFLGQRLAGSLLGLMGAQGFKFVIDPLSTFIYVPALIIISAGTAFVMILPEIRRISASECLNSGLE